MTTSNLHRENSEIRGRIAAARAERPTPGSDGYVRSADDPVLDEDDAGNVKDYLRGARTSGLNGAGGPTARCTPMVRVGHAALDAALAADRDAAPNLQAMMGAQFPGMDARPCTDAPAPACGRPADALALTPNRHGRGPTAHVSTLHRVVDTRGRVRTITVWHELATFDRN